MLNGCLEQPAGVALVCAPAGWGKSTLIAEWLDRAGTPVAWVQLDSADNDEARLCAHLAAAVGTAIGNDDGAAELERFRKAMLARHPIGSRIIMLLTRGKTLCCFRMEALPGDSSDSDRQGE